MRRQYINSNTSGEALHIDKVTNHPQVDRIFRKMWSLCMEVISRTYQAKDFSAAIAQAFSQKSRCHDWLCPAVYNALQHPLGNLIARCKTILAEGGENEQLAQEISEFVYDNLHILLALEETEWVFRNGEDAIARVQDIAAELGQKTTMLAIMARRRGKLEEIMERVERGERISRPHKTELYLCIPNGFTIESLDEEALATLLDQLLSLDHLRTTVQYSGALEKDIPFLDKKKVLAEVKESVEVKIGWIKKDTKGDFFTDGHKDPFVRACQASNIKASDVEGKAGPEIINMVLLPKATQEIMGSVIGRYETQKQPDLGRMQLKYVWGTYDTRYQDESSTAS